MLVLFSGLSIDFATNKLWWVNLDATQPNEYIMWCDLKSDCSTIQRFRYATLNQSDAPTALATYDRKLYILAGRQNSAVYVVNEDGSEPRLLRSGLSNNKILKIFIKETTIGGE